MIEDDLKEAAAAIEARDFAAAERLARAALARLADPQVEAAVRLRAAIGCCLALTGRRDEGGAMLRAEADAADTEAKHIAIAGAMVRAGFWADAFAQNQRLLDDGVRRPHVLRLAGNALLRIGRAEEAEALIREALDLGADRAAAESRLAPLLAPGNPASTKNILDRVITQGSMRVETRVSLALALLAQGKWIEAWPYYEGRAANFATHPEMPYPRWRHDLTPERVLIFRSEQGVGDVIMFSRFASILGGLGLPVMLMVAPRWKSLFSTLPGISEVLLQNQRVREAEVAWAPLASLLHFFGITPETVPPMQPYLSADPVRVAKWRSQLPDAGLRVGIAWQGKPGTMVDIGRSIPLTAFYPLTQIPDLQLVSLQKGFGTEQIEDCGFAGRILIPGPDFDEGADAFVDTAAMMMALDLVVTSDTSVAHLAGALGRPCFLALNKYPEWRWGMAGETTPWYPSMRLFRQRTQGDWDGVFRDIAAAARAFDEGPPPE